MRRSSYVIPCAVAASIFLSGHPLLTGIPSFGPAVSHAQEGWKAEYEAVCAQTDMAMTLSVEELKGLIARCDRLKPQIEAEEESTRKVYLRRLRMCRDLYKYMLGNKEQKSDRKDSSNRNERKGFTNPLQDTTMLSMIY
ncbi:MAG: hypothetical protein ACYC24_02660 [Desulfobacteria bacterium]